MTPEKFKQSAIYITKRNVTCEFVLVLAKYDSRAGHLILEYFTKSDPTEDEVEWCEINCAELLAEFPEIRTAETKCDKFSDNGHYEEDAVVYKLG